MKWRGTRIKDIEKYFFVISCCLLVFGYGVNVGNKKIFPFVVIENAKEAVKDWRENWHANIGLLPRQVRKTGYAGPQVPTLVPDRTAGGGTLVPSIIGGDTGLKLIDMNGMAIHVWKLPLQAFWGDGSRFVHGPSGEWQIQVRDRDVQVDDAVLYENGDVVFILSHIGIARVDRCGKLKWRIDQPAHHSLYRDESGALWALATRVVTEATPRLPLLDPPIEEELILQISPDDGRVLKEISILDVLYRSRLHYLFLNINEYRRKNSWNITHLNDVEILEPSLAAAFPKFKAGDIMVSGRTSSFIAVIDPATETVRWHKSGPFFHQHDPDFRPDGKITVFDNQTGDGDGRQGAFGGSTIMAVDPSTDTTRVIYAGTVGKPFYSDIQGSQQILPNRNLLITESRRGRVFEVTPEGAIVWEYYDAYEKGAVVAPARAQRYPESYAAFARQGC